MTSKDAFVMIYGRQSDEGSEVWQEFGTADETMSVRDVVDFAEEMEVRAW